jgi:preprotein translocase subunit YajC
MKVLFIAVLSLVMVTAALAHGGMEHILGTVSAVSDHSITVKLSSGESREVAVDSSTKFVRGNAAVALGDVQVGDRVVVHAGKHGDKVSAAEVQLGPVKPGARAQ